MHPDEKTETKPNTKSSHKKNIGTLATWRIGSASDVFRILRGMTSNFEMCT